MGNTVRVEIDQEKVYEGSLKEDWEILAAKEISDPDDKKPSDWVDTSMMDDPADKKPDDWVEEKRIIDPEAKKPSDWDDEEDGEWEAPMKDNDAYKGEWYAADLQSRVQGRLGSEEDRQPGVRGRRHTVQVC